MNTCTVSHAFTQIHSHAYVVHMHTHILHISTYTHTLQTSMCIRSCTHNHTNKHTHTIIQTHTHKQSYKQTNTHIYTQHATRTCLCVCDVVLFASWTRNVACSGALLVRHRLLIKHLPPRRRHALLHLRRQQIFRIHCRDIVTRHFLVNNAFPKLPIPPQVYHELPDVCFGYTHTHHAH